MEHEEELSLGLLVRALDAQTRPRKRKFRYSVESELKNEPGQSSVWELITLKGSQGSFATVLNRSCKSRIFGTWCESLGHSY